MKKNATKKELLLGIYFAFSIMFACVEVVSESLLVFIGYYTIALLNLANCTRLLNAHDKKQKRNKNAATTNRT